MGEQRLILDNEKGVVGVIYPDDRMPVDDNGIRADLMISMSSPIARTNMGQLYEQGLNRISHDVQKQAEKIYEVRGLDPAYDTIIEWIGDVNPNHAEILHRKLKTDQQREDFVKLCLDDYIYLWLPPFHENFCPSEKDLWNALRNMKKLQKKWGTVLTPITFWSPIGEDENGEKIWREYRTEKPFLIGSEYFIHLNKIPKISAPGCARVNHIGIPTKASSIADMSPIKMNPARFGEDEHRIAMMDVDVRWVSRLQNLYGNSPYRGVNRAIETILRADHPTNIPVMPVSNGELSAYSVVTKLFHSAMAILGLNSKDTIVDPSTLPLDMLSNAGDVDDIDADTVALDPLSESGKVKVVSNKKGRIAKKQIPIID